MCLNSEVSFWEQFLLTPCGFQIIFFFSYLYTYIHIQYVLMGCLEMLGMFMGDGDSGRNEVKRK